MLTSKLLSDIQRHTTCTRRSLSPQVYEPYVNDKSGNNKAKFHICYSLPQRDPGAANFHNLASYTKHITKCRRLNKINVDMPDYKDEFFL